MSKTELTTDALKGLPHLVIVTRDDGITVSQFKGEDAMERAHEHAQRLALADRAACVTVAARVRQIFTADSEHLAA
jgi:hypothetical protein